MSGSDRKKKEKQKESYAKKSLSEKNFDGIIESLLQVPTDKKKPSKKPNNRPKK